MLFKVRKKNGDDTYTVYGVQERYHYNYSDTDFLIYSKNGWEWVSAVLYEPVE